jgi:hypothetical protein
MVNGLESPVIVANAIEIVGPRPQGRSMQKSLAAVLGIEIGADELPAGTTAGLVLTVDHLHDAVRPRLELRCETGELRQPLTLSPGAPSAAASLSSAGPGALYLSVDPGAIGYPGCQLSATVMVEPEGRSVAFILGRVIRVPRLEKFTLSTEKVGDPSYAGDLEGADFDVIEKAGWGPAMAYQWIRFPLRFPATTRGRRCTWCFPGHPPVRTRLCRVAGGETRGRKTDVA